mgnify:FL=1
MSKQYLNSYTFWDIQTGTTFAREFVQGLNSRYSYLNSVDFASIQIFIANHRLMKGITDELVGQSESGSLLIPAIYAIGDLSPTHIPRYEKLDCSHIKPVIDKYERVLVLYHMISKFYHDAPSEHIFSITRNIISLIDEIHECGVTLGDVCVHSDVSTALHGQLSAKFLNYIFTTWPTILAEMGYEDRGAIHTKLVDALIKSWEIDPPEHPIIVAGSTGSIGMTSKIIKAVSLMEAGHIILPGVCPFMEDNKWQSMRHDHPQYMLRKLMDSCNIDRTGIGKWNIAEQPNSDSLDARLYLASLIMTDDMNDWHNTKGCGTVENIKQGLDAVSIMECDTIQEEALITAMAIRRAVATSDKNVSLITPNRTVVRYVISYLESWDIPFSESMGESLLLTNTGLFFLMVVRIVVDFTARELLSILRNDICIIGRDIAKHYEYREKFEVLLRKEQKGIDQNKIDSVFNIAINRAIADGSDGFLAWLNELRSFCIAGRNLSHKDTLQNFLDIHIESAENFSSCSIWSRETAGSCLLDVLNRLYTIPGINDYFSKEEYIAFLTSVLGDNMAPHNMDRKEQVQIMGCFESRYETSDIVIIAGLNEGEWPRHSHDDCWMTHSARQSIGLRTSDELVGLSAHDFVHGFCAKEVMLTRARNVAGQESCASRWLMKLKTLLGGVELYEYVNKEDDLYCAIKANSIPRENIVRIDRPCPRPAIQHRPQIISASEIQKLIRDPYAVYVKRVLKLTSLPDLEQFCIATRIRGIVIHRLFEYYHRIPYDVDDQDILYDRILKKILHEFPGYKDWIQFWSLKFPAMVESFYRMDKALKQSGQVAAVEVKGKFLITGVDDILLNVPVLMTAHADRIDKHQDGYAIYDIKTSLKDITETQVREYEKQLLAEALIAVNGGFEDLRSNSVIKIAYLYIRGLQKRTDIQVLKESHLNDLNIFYRDLCNLLLSYENESVGYLSRARMLPSDVGEYDHLSRVDQWGSL